MTVTRIDPGRPSAPDREARRAAEIGALRAALHAETLIAEALAQRSRGLVDLVEALARRALGEATDLADASARLGALSRRMRAALAEGETASRDLATLARRTLAPFDAGAGPRIAVAGPAVELSAEAARLVALTLFELGALSARSGALATGDGRVRLRWLRQAGGLRLVWRDCGGGTGDADGARLGAGAGLLPLLEERFGAPLKVRLDPLGLHAELTLPEADVSTARVSLVTPGTAHAPAPHAPAPAPSSPDGSGKGRSST